MRPLVVISSLVLTTVLVDNKTITTLAGFKSDKTIILDAGHAALCNIIKIKRESSIKHYQASKKPAI